jgi:hypothetical protein
MCVVKELDGEQFVEHRHKGTIVYGKRLVINCMGCKKFFIFDAETGPLGEVTIGRDT